MNIEDLMGFINFLQKYYQIDLIDYSGSRRNKYPAQDGERLLQLLEIYNKTLDYEPSE